MDNTEKPNPEPEGFISILGTQTNFPVSMEWFYVIQQQGSADQRVQTISRPDSLDPNSHNVQVSQLAGLCHCDLDSVCYCALLYRKPKTSAFPARATSRASLRKPPPTALDETIHQVGLPISPSSGVNKLICPRFHEWAIQYGPVVGLKLGPQNVVVLNSQQAVKE